jgi:hypothetical protein
LALLLAALPVLCSASSLSAKRENMSINWAPVVVAYEPSATAQDVMLPLPEGAETVRGFRYTIDTKEGEPVLRYASVVVTTRESAERIAAEYTSKLPGKPRAELVEDKAGKRLVLAVGDEEEVRTVTIFENGRGARVELVRVVQGAVPQGTPPEAQVVPRQPMPRGPMMRRGRRGGMRV